uniref:EOG090X014D n=1 Tax=Evadne anonyx TaxID=141404 RepID=A0A9N6WPN5_9CRUS|nr:EOG090X014D [Evadne anonyx]
MNRLRQLPSSLFKKEKRRLVLQKCRSLSSETVQSDAVTNQEIPTEADIVVIGGGSIGCNTLYHLTKLGMKNVVLLERDRLTSGTTWHSSGVVWSLRPSDVDVRLLAHTHQVLANLEEETGVDPGYIVNGGLFTASSKERLDEYKRLHTLGKAYGIESFILDPSETKKLYPLMNINDIYGTLYSPADGVLDPSGFCTALSRAAVRAGARIIENCPVTAINTDTSMFGSRQVASVSTDKGTIKTRCIINCTGGWATHISEMARVAIPLIVFKHASVVTERIEGVSKMPNVRDHDYSIAVKIQGDGFSFGGYENNPIFLDQPHRTPHLYELDWDVFGVHLQSAMFRFPVLEQTGIKSTVCGPESFTPDHRPLLGEEPTLRGFYHGCGFNSAGMMYGGGCGWQLAKWVVEGRPDIDMCNYDIRRFHPELTGNNTWIRQRSHEAYATNYSIVYPHDDPLASRNMKQSPLHSILQQSGCVFQERHGWERPGWFSSSGPAPIQPYDWYGVYDNPFNQDQSYLERLKQDYTFDFPSSHCDIGKECQAARDRVALFDMSYSGSFYLIGDDAQAAADWIFTNDMRRTNGETSYTCMLNSRAGVEADPTVSFIDESCRASWEPSFNGKAFYVSVNGDATYHTFAHIKNAIEDGGFKAEIINSSQEMSLLSIQGPNSRDLMQKLCPNDDFSNESFLLSTHRLVEIRGRSCRAVRVSPVGEMGWELHVPNSYAVEVYKDLMDAGRDCGIANAGYRAMDSMSVEKGYRHWHTDLRLEDDPLEAGLVSVCKLDSQVDFIGRSSLQQKRKSGLKKAIAGFTIQDRVRLMGMEAIWRNDQVVGYLRRGEFGFSINSSIGYGYVNRSEPDAPVDDQYLLNGEYFIESMGVKYPAQIHLKAVFDPKNLRMQGIY